MCQRDSWWFGSIAIATVIVYLSVPLRAQPGIKNNDYFEGRLAGEAAAHGDPIWFFGGFCLSGLGVLMAWSIKPTPPTGHLVGKSPVFIQGYIDGYKSRAAGQNTNYALAGCATAMALYVVLWLVFIYKTMSTIFDNW